MSQHLVSEACQCSSITSALCLLFITSYVFALTCAHTHTHAYKLQSSPFSFLLLFRHTHTHTELWGQDVLALSLLNTRSAFEAACTANTTNRQNKLVCLCFSRRGRCACVDWDRRARVTLSVKTNLNSHSRAKGSTTGVTKASCRRVRNLCAQMQVAFAKCS